MTSLRVHISPLASENLEATKPRSTRLSVGGFVAERALETYDYGYAASAAPIGNRHLSKSTSELSSPREMPEARPRSAAPPEHHHPTVYQKAHSFFSQLRVSDIRSAFVSRRRHFDWCSILSRKIALKPSAVDSVMLSSFISVLLKVDELRGYIFFSFAENNNGSDIHVTSSTIHSHNKLIWLIDPNRINCDD